MNAPAPQTITPERQQAAAQIGQVFNSMHEYLSTLMHTNPDGQRLTSQPMEYARKALEEASFWAIKHVLMHGIPQPPKAANDVPPTDAEERKMDGEPLSNPPMGPVDPSHPQESM